MQHLDYERGVVHRLGRVRVMDDENVDLGAVANCSGEPRGITIAAEWRIASGTSGWLFPSRTYKRQVAQAR